MLTVSVSDFNNNFEKYQNTPCCIENDGVKFGKFIPFKKGPFKRFNDYIISPILVRLGLKNRPLGLLKGKASFKVIGDWDIDHEDMFDDIDDLNGSMKNFSKARK